MRAHSCAASSARWSRNFSRVSIVPKIFPPHFLGGLHLARDLVGPVMRDVTIVTVSAHARSMGIMHGRFELFERIGAHFVARDAEGLGIHEFQHRSEEHTSELQSH